MPDPRPLALLLALLPSLALAEVKPVAIGGFAVAHELVIAAAPQEVFAALVGDVSGWWDHHFSPQPKKLAIEPRVGGQFVELFDDAGNGALHGTVILLERNKLLRLRGPLGLSGNAIDLVWTFELKPELDKTRLSFTCNAAGAVDSGWYAAVDRTWHHFLVERLKPFVEGRGAGKRK